MGAIDRAWQCDGIVRTQPIQRAAMHIVVLAWLYVTFAMALTMQPLLAGVAFFLAAGLGPIAIWAVLAARRRRSVRVARMNHRDDRDAEADQ